MTDKPKKEFESTISVPELPYQRQCPNCCRWIHKKNTRCPKCGLKLSKERKDG